MFNMREPPSALTEHHASVPSWCCVCLSVCTCVGSEEWDKLYACILAACVCLGHCAHDWSALASMWSWNSSHDVWYFIHKILLLSSFFRLVPRPYCAVFSLAHYGKGLGTDPSSNMLRGDLAPVSIHRDSVHLNKVGSNWAEQKIDNCSGTKRVCS